MTATTGYRGTRRCEPVGWPATPTPPPAPERTFCEHGLTDAYCFSRHSYSAICACYVSDEPCLIIPQQSVTSRTVHKYALAQHPLIGHERTFMVGVVRTDRRALRVPRPAFA